MNADKHRRSAVAAALSSGRSLTSLLVVVGFLVWATPVDQVLDAAALSRVRVNQAQLDHADKVPAFSSSEVGGFPELEIEESEEGEHDELAPSLHCQHFVARDAWITLRSDLVELGQPSGHRDGRGARAPPAA